MKVSSLSLVSVRQIMRALAVDYHSSGIMFSVNYNCAVKIWGNVFAGCRSGENSGFEHESKIVITVYTTVYIAHCMLP